MYAFVPPFDGALVASNELRPRPAIIERISSDRALSGSLDENDLRAPIQVVSNEAVVLGVIDATRLADPAVTPWGATLRRDIMAKLREVALADGYDHPAEGVVRASVAARGSEAASWFSWLILASGDDCRADVLRLLGRMPVDEVGPWAYDLAGAALLDRDLSVRDAAVCALESWGGEQAKTLLIKHEDPAPWLAEYARRVAAEL